MKLAITAVNGQLGRAIAKAAIARFGKESIIGIARTPEKAQDLGIEIRKGDYNSQEDFEKAFQGIDTAMVISGMDHPDKRIGQHRNVIQGAKQAGVRKIVYSSIFGNEGKCSFDAIINSNRQTEKDVQASGMDWIIGRNGLYIDEDIKAIPDYIQAGKIANCAATGRCAYTSRPELGFAYANLMQNDNLNKQIFNLCGPAITQQELVDAINKCFGEKLIYESMSIEAYAQDRKQAHGEFLGQIITGIYQGIYEGAFDVSSDFEKAAGRPHQTLQEMVDDFK